MEGRIMDGAETKKLATLPSREVLLAKLLGSMMSPLSGLARFFDGAKKELEIKGLTKIADLTVPVSEKAEEISPSESEAPASDASESVEPAKAE